MQSTVPCIFRSRLDLLFDHVGVQSFIKEYPAIIFYVRLIIFFVYGYNEAKTPANRVFANIEDEIE